MNAFALTLLHIRMLDSNDMKNDDHYYYYYNEYNVRCKALLLRCPTTNPDRWTTVSALRHKTMTKQANQFKRQRQNSMWIFCLDIFLLSRSFVRSLNAFDAVEHVNKILWRSSFLRKYSISMSERQE